MQRRSEIGLWIALVAVAVLAGVAIAGPPALGGDAEPATISASGTTTGSSATTVGDGPSTTTSVPSSTTASTTTTVPPTTAPPPPEPRPNDQVTVLVANGTSVPGAAASLGDRLEGEGHPVSGAVTVRSFASSEVWFADGWEVEARALAERLALAPESVRPVPVDPAVGPGDAAVVVVIGPELAAAL